MINIAVLGYGTVGSGVVEVINTNHESINKRAGDEINIKYVLDLRDFPGDPVEKVLVHDYEVIYHPYSHCRVIRTLTFYMINPVSDQQPRIHNNLTIHPLILITQLHNLHISRI